MKQRWREFQGHEVTATALTAGQVRVASVPTSTNMHVTRDDQYAALKFYFRFKSRQLKL